MLRSIRDSVSALVLCLFVTCVGAQNSEKLLVLKDASQPISAAPYLDILEDPGRQLTLNDVTSSVYADKFVANTQDRPSFGRTRSAFWLRFDLVNVANNPWYLLMDAMLGDELSLIIIGTDASDGYAQKQTHYRRPLWALNLPKGQKLRVYIRATNGDAIFNLPVVLLTANQLLEKSADDYRFHSAIYACLLMIAAYNALLFFSLRESSYLTLAVHIVSMVFTMHRMNPVFESLAFLGHTGNYFFTAPVFFTIGSYVLFTRQILQTKTHLPKFDTVLKMIIAVSVLLIPIVGMIPKGTLIPSSILPISFVVILFTSLYAAKRGNDPVAKYFFMIFVVVFCMDIPLFIMAIVDAKHWGVDKESIITTSTVVLALLLSLVQAERVRLLRENLQRAKVSSEAKDGFLAAMSHELRTPLNAIFGLSTLLQISKLNTIQRDYVKKLEASSRYMLQLMGNILDIKKIENQSFQLEHKIFILKSVLDSIHDLLHEQAHLKGLKLVFENTTEIIEPLSGDRVRLTQVLINLLGNAIKYTQQGQISLSVKKLDLLTTTDKVFLRFDITDTGVGIAQDKIKTIFKPFVQLDSKIPSFQEGVGLGLAISEKLIQMMGGVLEVESVLGKGSHFFFSIPFDVQQESLCLKQEIPMSNVQLSLPGTRILLVDDYELNLYIWRKIISNMGAHVAISLDGQSTILQLQKQSFDIVLMDISLPDMSGFEVTQWIRQHSITPDIPIIALTAHVTPMIEQKCKEVGMNGFLSKPFDLQNLYALIQKTLYVDV